MKGFLRYILFAGAAALGMQALAGEPFAPLLDKCGPGHKEMLSEPMVIEGIVVSDYRSPNMELNPNVNYYSVDLTMNERTAYVMAADGSRGVRLIFDESSENRLARYDRVRLDLNGCTLTRTAEPDCCTLSGVTAFNVLSAVPGTADGVPVKRKYIGELTDEDLYTFVALRDAEFVFKEGSYTNIWEPYAQYSREMHQKYEINNRMDCWPSLLRDSKGASIYMLVNTLCTWRRAGRQMPQGTGTLSGVVVHTPMRRYGGDMGRYSIRPLDEGDIGVAKKKASSYKRLTGWMTDGSAGPSLEFELLGSQGNLRDQGKSGDRILNDTGKGRGYLWTDSGAFVHVDGDYNAPGTEDKGFVSFGAIVFKAPTVDWYEWDNMGRMIGTKSFFVEFSTKKVQGEMICVSMELGAGNQDGNFSWNFPLEWKAEYSVDGGEYVPLKDAATGKDIFVMRSLPWWDKVIDGTGHTSRLYTPYDCGMGLQQRTFTLPASAFGKDKVVLRLSPASGHLSQIRSNPANDVRIENSTVRRNCKQTTIIRFGTIVVDYK